MRIIISPAKKMNVDNNSLDIKGVPRFLPQAKKIKQCLQRMTAQELQALWKCNDAIARLNYERLQGMDLEKNLTPAILSYEGIQYQYMAPGVFEDSQLEFLQQHLRILSGFYGMLCPFDGIVPYRLEMQAKLMVEDKKNLYEYWGDRLAKQLIQETDFILNLASKEYSKAITPHLSKHTHMLTCTFGEEKEGKVVEKGTMCKMARGEMVRFLTEKNITYLDGIKSFDRLGYTFSASHSTENHLVFIKGGD
ncbi:peroxide stress protein YaaA [Anaerotignum sp.]|uniref:peroxide stress protein YaaA n=1 Tax=Anaerotignum sp. TaxID=2039241 RepID=UPI0028A8FB16|nr:peroxide stress protein YaaA [Anaerotignum sp.]